MNLLRRLPEIAGRPVRFPALASHDVVVAGYDQGLGERMIVCENLVEMQQIYDSYAQGGALTLNWYTGPDPGFIAAVIGEESE